MSSLFRPYIDNIKQNGVYDYVFEVGGGGGGGGEGGRNQI